MPYGMTYPRFIPFATAAFLSMLMGAQWVHQKYKPLEDLDELIETEYKRRLAEMEHK
ncbi:ubiquinol-cytochrome c reductase complex assembly factor 6 sloth 2 [Nomia melanderi]|uniref:ubiquinol-cytochrome c reductase complex assembly factor 6 sloth 2 n=1 Tax=Nomia melanderi TaxID=2448451 RepID=UPI0013046032|nr:uncharacterized protein LOC116431656 [Nomia melanderi]